MADQKRCERRFLAEIEPGPRHFSPLRAALALSQAAEPGRLPSQVLLPLLQGLPALDERLAGMGKPYQKFEALSSYFFGELGFLAAGPAENGLAVTELHAVVTRRRGRALSLALLYYDLARRLAFPLRALAQPGGVLLGSHWLPRGHVLDPADGAVLPLDAARHRVELLISGRRLAFQPQRLNPLSSRQLLERYLVAMRIVYQAEGLAEEALRAADWRVRLMPRSRAARWDRGLLLYSQDRYEDADRDLGGLLGRTGRPRDDTPERPASTVKEARENRAAVNHLLASLSGEVDA